MRLLARQFLRLLVVAAAISVSGINSYAGVLAAFDVHEHGHHGLHSHPAHDNGSARDVDHATLDQDHDRQDPASSEQPCTHVHVHCCSTFAVAASECGLKSVTFAPAAIPFANSHIPPGQLAAPLFRPPRTSA